MLWVESPILNHTTNYRADPKWGFPALSDSGTACCGSRGPKSLLVPRLWLTYVGPWVMICVLWA